MKHNNSFTHYGWFMDCVPVKIAEINSPDPIIATRFVPEFFLDVAETTHFMCSGLIKMFDPDYKPTFKLLVTGTYL